MQIQNNCTTASGDSKSCTKQIPNSPSSVFLFSPCPVIPNTVASVGASRVGVVDALRGYTAMATAAAEIEAFKRDSSEEKSTSEGSGSD